MKRYYIIFFITLGWLPIDCFANGCKIRLDEGIAHLIEHIVYHQLVKKFSTLNKKLVSSNAYTSELYTRFEVASEKEITFVDVLNALNQIHFDVHSIVDAKEVCRIEQVREKGNKYKIEIYKTLSELAYGIGNIRTPIGNPNNLSKEYIESVYKNFYMDKGILFYQIVDDNISYIKGNIKSSPGIRFHEEAFSNVGGSKTLYIKWRNDNFYVKVLLENEITKILHAIIVDICSKPIYLFHSNNTSLWIFAGNIDVMIVKKKLLMFLHENSLKINLQNLNNTPLYWIRKIAIHGNIDEFNKYIAMLEIDKYMYTNYIQEIRVI